MAEFLAAYGPFFGVLAAALAGVFLFVLFLLLRQSAAKTVAAASTVDPKLIDVPSPALIPLMDLRLSFRNALADLRRFTPSYRWRYAVPWYLVLGEKGAGKTTLLSRLDALQSSAAAPPSMSRACTWHFFDGGVMLDVSGQLVLDPDHPDAADNRAWRYLLGLLLEHRPVRPIDGVIVALPCDDLIGPQRLDMDALLAKAGEMQSHLVDLQQRFGLKLPVYVVVTKCDRIPGFRSFWQEASARHRDEMVGWSNSQNIDEAMTADTFDTAFADVVGRLHRLHLDLAGKDGELADAAGAFLFPGEFERLGGPLSLYCTSLFRQSVYHDSFLFRGVYFTGDDGSLPLRQPMIAAPDRAAAAVQHWPLFVPDLFTKKIMRERSLAAVARSAQRPRARPVRIAAAGLAAFIVLGSAALWFAAAQLDRETASLQPSLTSIVTAAGNLASRIDRSRVDPSQSVISTADATDILKRLADINVRSLRTVLLPSSWFGSIDNRIVGHFTLGFNTIVLNAMRHEFDRRTAALIAGAGNPDATAPGLARLTAYVGGLKKLEANAVLFNRLGTPQGSLTDVEALTAFLLDAKLPHDFFVDSDLYDEALKNVVVKPFDPAEYAQNAFGGLQTLFRSLDQQLAIDGPVLGQFRQLVTALDDLDRAVSGGSGAGAQLIRVNDQLQTVAATLASPDFAWTRLNRADDDADFAGTLRDVGASAYLGPRPRQYLTEGGNQLLKRVRADIASLQTRSGVPLIDRGKLPGGIELSPPLSSLAAVLPGIVHRPFMAAVDGRRIAAAPASGGATTWDIDLLQQATALYFTYEQFQDAELQSVAVEFRHVVDAAARQQLEAGMASSIAHAQVPDAVAGGTEEAVLFARTQLFGRAARSLGDLLTILSQLGLEQTYSDLRDVAGNEAYGLLRQTDRLLEREQLFTARTDLRSWSAALPATVAAFGLRDDTEVVQYLDTQRGWINRLADSGARPLTDFLARSDFSHNWRPIPLVAKWQRIIVELQKFQNANPSSSVASLDNFIRFDLAGMTRSNCLDQLAGDRFEVTGDYFLDRRNLIRQSLLGECGGAVGEAGYAQLADMFNRMLAGRYPFAAPDHHGAEASVAAITDYLHLYATRAPAIRKALGRGASLPARSALAFLDQMDAVQAFFAPFLGGSERTHPGIDVEVDFRVNRGFEKGADQIIEWQFAVGDQVIRRGQQSPPQRWHPDDPVTVSLRWAKDGTLAPILQSVGDDEKKRRIVTYAYSGRWSLLRLLQEHGVAAVELDRRADTSPYVLKFTARTAAVAEAAAREPQAVTQAKVFLRVRLSAASPDAKTSVALMLPDFPTRAPLLGSSEARR